MEVTYGKFDADGGKGLLRAVHFPQLALTDTKTGDDRRLAAEGGGVRSLPRPLKAAWVTGSGHNGGVPVGVLQEVTFGDDNVISGKGWLLDDDNGRRQEYYLETNAIFHNSVDLAEVKVKVKWVSDDPSDGEDFWTIDYIDFQKWNIAATHFVDVPAFADAHGEIMASYSDEIMAAFEQTVDRSKPLVVEFASTRVNMIQPEPDPEIMASLAEAIVEPFDDYHLPEADKPTSVQIDADGRIFGHVAQWGACHQGIDDRCVVAPKPGDYSEFHQPNAILTERGPISAGPMFFLGGHPKNGIGNTDRFAAYGGVENVFGYVRCIPGKFGPWISGRVVPSADPETVYVARASRKSGHWVKGRLAAVVCCNLRGMRVADSQLALDEDSAYFGEDGEVLEMVASFRGPTPPEADDGEMLSAREAAAEKILELMQRKPGFNSMYFQTPPNYAQVIQPYVFSTGANTGQLMITTETTETVEMTVEVEDDDLELALALLELEAEQG